MQNPLFFSLQDLLGYYIVLQLKLSTRGMSEMATGLCDHVDTTIVRRAVPAWYRPFLFHPSLPMALSMAVSFNIIKTL
jgi:hypothetical protein